MTMMILSLHLSRSIGQFPVVLSLFGVLLLSGCLKPTTPAKQAAEPAALDHTIETLLHAEDQAVAKAVQQSLLETDPLRQSA